MGTGPRRPSPAHQTRTARPAGGGLPAAPKCDRLLQRSLRPFRELGGLAREMHAGEAAQVLVQGRLRDAKVQLDTIKYSQI